MSETRPILIVGAAGQVGRELQRTFAGRGPIVAVDRESIDLADASQIRELVQRTRPGIVLNAAAYTAVDRAESEPEAAHAINADAARILAEEAHQLNALFVHYSTDYVFDGTNECPWTEQDLPNPLSVYGATKLAGEQEVQRVGGAYLIFRTSWVYGPHGNNFLFTILRLAREREKLSIVDDQFGAPTTSIELAEATRAVVDTVLSGSFADEKEWAGLYHMTCAGSTTWCGFTHAIIDRAAALLEGKHPKILPISTSEYPTPATRPRNSVLSNAKLYDRFGVRLAPWETALETVLAILQSNETIQSPAR